MKTLALLPFALWNNDANVLSVSHFSYVGRLIATIVIIIAYCRELDKGTKAGSIKVFYLFH